VPEELGRLRDWVMEWDWRRWDEQIERDSGAGRLDGLFDQALEAHHQGKAARFELPKAP